MTVYEERDSNEEKPLLSNNENGDNDGQDGLKKDSYNDKRVPPPAFSWAKLWLYTGPGWLMSIAYLDPGNKYLLTSLFLIFVFEGDLLAGTHGGYGLIWTLFAATFCGLVIQIVSARVGIVTGRDLAVLCRQQFSKPLSLILWVMAEIAIIGSDIQEVIGTAIAFKILFGFPIWLGSIITILDTFSFLFIHACGVRKLEAFFAVLVATMAICFWANMVIVAPNGGEVMKGFLPGVPSGSMDQLIGLIGSIIMPHNLFLHSALVQSRGVDCEDKVEVREANKYFSIEAGVSLFISAWINFSVICTFAYYHLKDGSEEIDLENAHQSLQQSFGDGAKIIWALGLMAAGQSSTMTGTYAGQFVMQGFINLHIPTYLRVFVTRSIAIIPAIIVAFIGNLDSLQGFLNILQAIQLPFALIPLLKFSSNSKIMGEFKSYLFVTIFCACVSIVLIGLNIAKFIPGNTILIDIVFILYFGIIATVIFSPIKELEPIDEFDLDFDEQKVNTEHERKASMALNKSEAVGSLAQRNTFNSS